MASRRMRILVLSLAATGAAVVAVSVAQGGVDAEVTDKAVDENGPYIVARTDVGDLTFRRYIPSGDWMVIQEGDDVVYDLVTGETEVYTWESGSLIWRG